MIYDRTDIATVYDAGRGYTPEVMRLWLDAIVRHVPLDAVSDIVDIGCGTGRYSQALATHFAAAVTGIEPSAKMLAEARAKQADGVTFLGGQAEALPLADNTADLAFLSMAFHHLADPGQAAAECRRVLRPGGCVVLRNSTLEQTVSFSHIRFFPGLREVFAKRLPSARQVAAPFEAAGFALLAHDIVVHPMATSWAELAERFRHRADSTLAALDDADFEAGMAALRRHAETADPAEAVLQNVDLFVFRAPA